MARHLEEEALSTRVAAQLDRTSDYFAKLDGRALDARPPPRRVGGLGGPRLGRRIAYAALAILFVMIATSVLGVVVNGIGVEGLALSLFAMIAAAALFFLPRRERPIPAFKETMSPQAVTRRLESVLQKGRTVLPAAAVQRVEAISRQLPMLESRLAETDALDPIAQDARRLMGKHLPELIERYERLPPNYRAERDSEGLTVDERLIVGLDAAQSALDEFGRRLSREDLSAFEAQGRFLESRYAKE